MAQTWYRYQRLLQLRFRRVYMGSLRFQARDSPGRVWGRRLCPEQQEDDGRLQHDDDGWYGYARRRR